MKHETKAMGIELSELPVHRYFTSVLYPSKAFLRVTPADTWKLAGGMGLVVANVIPEHEVPVIQVDENGEAIETSFVGECEAHFVKGLTKLQYDKLVQIEQALEWTVGDKFSWARREWAVTGITTKNGKTSYNTERLDDGHTHVTDTLVGCERLTGLEDIPLFYKAKDVPMHAVVARSGNVFIRVSDEDLRGGLYRGDANTLRKYHRPEWLEFILLYSDGSVRGGEFMYESDVVRVLRSPNDFSDWPLTKAQEKTLDKIRGIFAGLRPKDEKVSRENIVRQLGFAKTRLLEVIGEAESLFEKAKQCGLPEDSHVMFVQKAENLFAKIKEDLRDLSRGDDHGS